MTRPYGTPLTDEQREFAKRLYVEGYTASQIAASLFETFGIVKTRSAICGALNRAGVRVGVKRSRVHRTPKPFVRRTRVGTGPAPKAAKPPKPPKAAKSLKTKRPDWSPRPTTPADRRDPTPEREPPRAPDARPTGLLDLRFGQCRSVIGKGDDGFGLFCGAPVVPRSSWCPTCHAAFTRSEVA